MEFGVWRFTFGVWSDRFSVCSALRLIRRLEFGNCRLGFVRCLSQFAKLELAKKRVFFLFLNPIWLLISRKKKGDRFVFLRKSSA